MRPCFRTVKCFHRPVRQSAKSLATERRHSQLTQKVSRSFGRRSTDAVAPHHQIPAAGTAGPLRAEQCGRAGPVRGWRFTVENRLVRRRTNTFLINFPFLQPQVHLHLPIDDESENWPGIFIAKEINQQILSKPCAAARRFRHRTVKRSGATAT